MAAFLALAAPAQAQTSITLVSNAGQTNNGATVGLHNDYVSGFTTGGNAAGYTLTRVDIPFNAVASPTFSVSIRSSSGGNPGSSLGTLTISGTLTAGTNTFTASGGIALAANTTYFLMIDATAADSFTNLKLTKSNAEDSGGAAGWSIADSVRWRSYSATSGSWSTLSNDGALRFAVHGYAKKLPPRASPEARALKKTLAAVASRTMASALGHINARFGDAAPSGSLTLAGRPVNLAARDAHATHGAYDNCPLDGFEQDAPGCGGWSRSFGTDDLLHGSAFSLALGAAEESGDPGTSRWSVWGRGDYGFFEGSPRGLRYDGKARTGWLGIDARQGRWVAGLALSHGVSEADYGYDGGEDFGRGRLETTLTALYPYGRWTLDDGLEIRGVLGAGTGEARHKPAGGARETGDLGMRMASAGIRKALPPLEGIDLAARADAGTVHMEVDDGPETIGGVSADSWRLRLGLEASRRFELEEAVTMTPFVEAAARRDGGDGLAGTGLEVAGGVRYSAPGVEIEARGRMLAAHSENGAREHGMSLTARVGPGAEGRGFSLSLAPRWGAPPSGAKALWRNEMPQPSATGTGNEAAMNARIGYGFAPASGRLLTPFAETGLVGNENRRLRLGTRFDAPRMGLGAELSGERRQSADAAPGHAFRLDLTLRF